MDNAQVRRGKAASHLEWGEATALLVFTDLASFAIGRIVKFEYGELGRASPAILDVVSREKVLLGQFADLYPESFSLTWEEGAYLKNGVVFETMLGMVTSLYAKIKGGALDLSGWARDLGMWHQAMDDLYDVMGSPVLGGKSTNIDGQRNLTKLKSQRDILSWINRLENSLYSGAPGGLSREVVEALRDDKRRMISQNCKASGGDGQMFEVDNGAALGPTSPESCIEGTEVTEKNVGDTAGGELSR